MKRMVILLAGIFAFVSTQSCNLLDSDGEGGIYPTTIRPIEPSKLAELRQRFEELNGPQVCFELDEYGFLKFAYCSGRPVLRAVLSEDSEVSVSKAKRMLLANKEFTGLADTAALAVIGFNDMPGCIRCDGSAGDIRTIKRGIDFERQVYLGLEVLESRYTVILDSIGVMEMVGHWYDNITVPISDKWSENRARQSLAGKAIIWYGLGGDKNTFVVTPEDLLNRSRKVILQHRVGGNIELRVAWEIPVGKGFLKWNIYVDTTTGEELETRQLFVT